MNEWQTCKAGQGCQGAQVPPFDGCLGHLSADQLKTHLDDASRGDRLDGRGVTFESDLIDRVFTANLLETLSLGRFDGASFNGDLNLDGIVFAGEIRFPDAQFRGNASFDRALFKGPLNLGNARFEGNLSMRKARFESANLLGPFLVVQRLNLDMAQFENTVVIDVAAFVTTCELTSFAEGVTLLLGPRSHLILERCNLGRSSIVSQSKHFIKSHERQTKLNSAEENPDSPAEDLYRPEDDIYYESMWFDTSPKLLEDVVFGTPGRWDTEPSLTDSSRPRVLSLRETDIAGLTISRVDLAACRFIGAFNLDRLRLEGGPELFSVAGGAGWAVGRQSIAEEHLYRMRPSFTRKVEWKPGSDSKWYGYRSDRQLNRLEDAGWYLPRSRVPKSLERFLATPEAPEAQNVVSAYRALRKAREDMKDQAGAADFYYGEMEMRLLSPWTRRGERLLLWFYRLVSGYGMRASRALIALTVTILAFSVLLERWGFREHQSFMAAILFSAQSTTSLLRPPEVATTQVGGWLNLILRLLGPLFFGLTLISLRARVKR